MYSCVLTAFNNKRISINQSINIPVRSDRDTANLRFYDFAYLTGKCLFAFVLDSFWGIVGERWFDINETNSFSLLGVLPQCHFRENQSRNETVRMRTDRQNEDDFTICLMLFSMKQIKIYV